MSTGSQMNALAVQLLHMVDTSEVFLDHEEHQRVAEAAGLSVGSLCSYF